MLSYFELLLNGLPELKYLGLDGLRELAVVLMKVPQKSGQRLWKRNNRSSQAEPPAEFCLLVVLFTHEWIRIILRANILYPES